jgi:hypothetical protein
MTSVETGRRGYVCMEILSMSGKREVCGFERLVVINLITALSKLRRARALRNLG